MDISLLVPPLLAGLIVLATHVPLGRQVLARGIIFIDLAVAQLAGLGVILMHVIDPAPTTLAVQIAALLMALLGGLLFRWLETRWASRLEAVIGATFVLSATAALLLLAGDPHGGEQLKELLAGQLLWVTYDDLALPAILTASILLLWCLPWNFIGLAQSSLLFYGLFALAVTTSVQLVGVYLVFASLIFPAFGASLKVGYVIGVLGYAVGLGISLATDLPTGPVIVWSLAISAVLAGSLLHSIRKKS